MASDDLAALGMHSPGHSRGLLDIPRWRFLLSLLVKKEMRVRYRGSVLGMVWSYVKPAVQLAVYYFALGKFLRLEKVMPNFVVYLFSGMVIINFFNEVVGNTTRSVVNNGALVGKIYLPRELFPVSSVWVAFVHFVPQVVVLIVGALLFGWRPGPANLAAVVLCTLLTAAIGLGIGLAFAAWNVMFRDAENLTDLIAMVAMWVCPVFYSWQQVQSIVPDWLWTLYQLNPLAVAVELSRYGFWVDTRGVVAEGASAASVMPPNFVWWTAIALVVSALLLVFGQWVFRRLEGKFAQEL